MSSNGNSFIKICKILSENIPQNKNQASVFKTGAWFEYSLFFELLEHIHEFFRYRHADFAEVFKYAYALIGY